jgi:hypothetical protein
MLPLILVVAVVYYFSQQNSAPKSVTDVSRPPTPLQPDNSQPGFLPGTDASWWNSDYSAPPLINAGFTTGFTNITPSPVDATTGIAYPQAATVQTPAMQAAAQPQAFSAISALRVTQPTSTPSVGLLAQKRAFTM